MIKLTILQDYSDTQIVGLVRAWAWTWAWAGPIHSPHPPSSAPCRESSNPKSDQLLPASLLTPDSSVMQLLLFLLSTLLLGCLLFNGVQAAKKSKEDDRSNAGLDALKETLADPQALRAAYERLKDPKVLREVQAMMDDPRFLSTLSKLKEDPSFHQTLEAAAEMFGDPGKTAQILSEINEELSDANIGLKELARTARNPKLLAEAMEDLKNPEIAKEVEKMMKDPQFIKEMKELTDNPRFKAAMTRASVKTEVTPLSPFPPLTTPDCLID